MKTALVCPTNANVTIPTKVPTITSPFPQGTGRRMVSYRPIYFVFQFLHTYPTSEKHPPFSHTIGTALLTTYPPFLFYYSWWSTPISITTSAYLSQPHGKTAIVSGLNYTSRIFALLGEILVRIRVDKRSPPQGQFATARLEEVQALHSRIMAALVHAPESLRLKPVVRAGSTMNGVTSGGGLSSDFGGSSLQATFDEVRDFFDNPNAPRTNALNPFLVMQANLYVTQVRWVYFVTYDRLASDSPVQQLVRFVIEQYRDELITSLQGSVDEEKRNEDREVVARDLLNILHSIPIQSIATNGPSLVRCCQRCQT